jgi:uncharacterized protein (TIGR03435 family)
VLAAAAAQNAKLSFDVATIKLHAEPITTWSDPFARGRTVTATASKLTDLITTAYGVRYDQISGVPTWATSGALRRPCQGGG